MEGTLTRGRLRLALLLAASLAIGCGGERGTRIVLLTIDTLRQDSFAGAPGIPSSMPQTRATANRGQVFGAAYAASPATQPTHATLFTGLPPWRHGVTRNGLVLGEEAETVAERLRRAGFATVAVVSSFPLHARFGFARGFDVYEQVFELSTGSRQWEGTTVEGGAFYALAERVTERALARLDAARGPRQFFWFHYFDPHSPYGDRRRHHLTLPGLLEVAEEDPDAAPRWIERARALYEEDVAALDRSLGRLFERLARDEQAYDTHLIFTADHGESFGEDGSLGHGSRVSEGQLHVPLFVVSPRLEPGVRSDVAGSSDVAATLLSLAGLDPGALPGRDLTAPLEAAGSAVGMRRGYDPPQLDPRVGGRARIVQAPRFFAVVDDALWTGDSRAVVAGDLDDGPPPPPELEHRLRELFGRFEAELSGADAAEDLDPETRRALEALGYTR